MVLWSYCKMEVVAFIVLLYIGVEYWREENDLQRLSGKKNTNASFVALLLHSGVVLVLDALTSVTVNFTDVIPDFINRLLYLALFWSYEGFGAAVFRYWLQKAQDIPHRRRLEYLSQAFATLAVIITALFIPQLEFTNGFYSNYSSGESKVVCLAIMFLFCAITIVGIFEFRRSISTSQVRRIVSLLLFCIVILVLQVFLPEFIGACIAIILIDLSIFFSLENPAILFLVHYQKEMVNGFANLVENRDDSTGGHIKRSSAYAEMIAENLRKNPKYRKIITRDYLDNLSLAAPMHDIGKISTPDAILKKAGKLTDEEYAVMKMHAPVGGRIIRNSFSHLSNTEYEKMAEQVAAHHHEKWNGKGYPDGIAGEDIPLCARIMAVADVFDAVSAKRCYRAAMPLQKCFDIIRSGSGTDFDPEIVDAFFEDPKKIEEIYRKYQE